MMIATGAFLLLCLLAGGASRSFDTPLVVLRPLAVLLAGLSLLLVRRSGWQGHRAPLLLLGAFALTMAIQLVPLPPRLWNALPLSALYHDALASEGLDGRWRPLSIAPDLTVNSLLALLPPVAVLLVVAAWPEQARVRLLGWVLGGVAASAVLGLAQFVGGANSPLYLWSARSEAVADGFFANRNHQAVFLACGLALLGAWILAPQRSASGRAARWGIAVPRLAIGGALAVLLLAAVVASGSRTGTALAVLAAGYSYWTVVRSPALSEAKRELTWPVRAMLNWGWLVVPLLLAVMAIAGRAVTFQRLLATDPTSDERVRAYPIMKTILQQVLPWGSGYGTFDPLFRTFEPAWFLHYGYFNHAHNDVLEMVLTGGLPAVLVMLAAAIGWGYATVRLFRATNAPHAVVVGRSAAVCTALVVLASLVDYPARTPLIACLLAILALWMTGGIEAIKRKGRSSGKV